MTVEKVHVNTADITQGGILYRSDLFGEASEV
jgi:hypothetical protein